MAANKTPVLVPKHRQIRQWFLQKVASEDFKPGEQVPGETELMGIHNVSRATIRRAMDELEFEGMIRRYRGKGTFLLTPRKDDQEDVKKLRWGCMVRHWVARGASILASVESLAQRTGNEVIVEYVGDSPESIRAAVERMVRFGVDGMILQPTPALSEELYRPFFDAGIPVVCLHHPLEGTQAPVVTYDHRRSANEATRFLVELKHRRIGFVSAMRYWSVEQSIEGYREVLQELGIEPDDQLLSFESTVADDPSFSQRGYKATLRLLSLPNPPTAIITLNDETAANAYRAIKSRQLRVPQDISVVAMNSNGEILAASLDPPLMVWNGGRAHQRLGEQLALTLDQVCSGQIQSTGQIIWVEPAVAPHGSVSLAP